MFSKIRTEDKKWYLILLMTALYSLVGSFFFQSPGEVFQGFKAITLNPSPLLTDYMAVGGIGAALFNTGLMALISLGIYALAGVPLTAGPVAAYYNLIAFTAMGKNLLNAPWFYLGVVVYCYFLKVDFKDVAAIAMFSTGLSPLVTWLAFGSGLPVVYGYILGAILATCVGFLLPMVAKGVIRHHKGHSIYNNGYALGLLTFLAVSLLRAFSIEPSGQSIVMEGYSFKLFLFLAIIHLLYMVPMILKPNWKDFKSIQQRTGVAGTDVISDYDLEAVLFQMGAMAFVGLGYIYLVGGDLNGLTLSGFYAMIGFVPMGKNFRNTLPIITGIALCALITTYDISAPAIVMAALLGTTLAPIAGNYGIIAGVITGMVHLLIVTQGSLLHGGLLLYNNGFCGGIVSSIMVPILDGLKVKRFEDHIN